MTLPEGVREHRAAAAERAVACAVLTVSDSRTLATDESGRLAVERLVAAGFTVVVRELLPNDEAALTARVAALAADAAVDVVLITGGTGLGTRDRSVEAVRPLLTKELPGFGELFRQLSFQEQIGPAAMLTRALAGAINSTFVVVLPGSKAAVALASDRLLVPELRHAVRELRR
ncbi:MAG: MogA/MoaB family molybdenum cofactor biosynthesis protein [Gemmatimonadaceae bacterium]|nr:MogA/MoaB family molybdenum cofactor biosynthesis protein [Gemmatimonadaceae bacterium]